MKLLHIIAVTFITLTCGTGAFADTPNTIHMVVGFAPGGGTDTAARLIANKLAVALNKTIIVENRVGAGGTIGATFVKNAKNDGNTLFFGSSAEMVINPTTRKNPPYNTTRDFSAIGEVGVVNFVLVVPIASPFNNVKELVDKAIKEPGKLNYSSFGAGSTNHLMGEMFLADTGIKATHVPYQGSAPALNALLSGDIDWSFETVSVALPHIKSGKIKVLATPSPKRLGQLPDTPTLIELGYSNLDMQGWMGLFAPINTPEIIISKINTALNEVLVQSEIQKQLHQKGVDIKVRSAKNFGEWITGEENKWLNTAKLANISIE